MDERNSPEDLEKDIGYTFHDETLLEDALTRQSYINDNHIARKDCMDPLATVGDAILGALAVCRLFENGGRDKGTLTTDKIRGVNRDRTRAFTREIPAPAVHPLGKRRGEKPDLAAGTPGLRHRIRGPHRCGILTPEGPEATGSPLSIRSWTGYTFFK
jgi:hypothetical protein